MVASIEMKRNDFQSKVDMFMNEAVAIPLHHVVSVTTDTDHVPMLTIKTNGNGNHVYSLTFRSFSSMQQWQKQLKYHGSECGFTVS